MADDLTDAKWDDAAELLQVVDASSASVRERMATGVLEFLIVLSAWSIGRLANLDDQDATTRVFWLLTLLCYPVFAATQVRRRRSVGGDVSALTWLVAAGVLVATLIGGLALGDSAGDTVARLSFAVGVLTLGTVYRHLLLLVFGTAVLLVGLAPLVF